MAQAEHVYNMWLHSGVLSRVMLLASKTAPRRYPSARIMSSRVKTTPNSVRGVLESLLKLALKGTNDEQRRFRDTALIPLFWKMLCNGCFRLHQIASEKPYLAVDRQREREIGPYVILLHCKR